MEKQEKKKSHWGKGIFALYGGFVVFIVSIVIYVTLQDYSLVEDNYYNKGVEYQSQIERQKNSASLKEKPVCRVSSDKSMYLISFPESLYKGGFEGEIHFFRPSDKKHDKIVTLMLDQDGKMMIPLGSFIKGHWRIKLSWKSGDLEYYSEEIFTL